MARGYLNRPDLTLDRFIADPFDAKSGARLYRTGDRGCRRSNGMIDFFGRDEALAHLCFACAGMLAERVPAKSERLAHLTKLIASCLAEKYTTAACRGLPALPENCSRCQQVVWNKPPTASVCASLL